MDVGSQETPRIVWKHPNPESTNMAAFINIVNQKHSKNIKTYTEFQKWSVTELGTFWGDVWDAVGMLYEGEYTSVVDENARMDSIPDWFPGVRLNYAECSLFTRGTNGPLHRTTKNKEDNKVAITFVREGGTEPQTMTWGALRRRVGQFSQALRANGVKKGDRVAGVVSNSAEAFVLFLAVAAIGAVFSSSATDMGVSGILGRMVQIQPTWIFMDDAAIYNAEKIDLGPKIREIVDGMKDVKEFMGLVTLPRFDLSVSAANIHKCQTLATFLSKAHSDELIFERVPFRYPFVIVYSSGTTGKSKCIVHCGGGCALNARKEQFLHFDVDANSTYLQYTATGWIMYVVQVSNLQFGAHTVVYDGSPFAPDPTAFIKLIGDYKVTHLGSSPKYFSELQHRGISPRDITDLSNLRVVSSVGMVLSPALYDWFYDQGFPASTQLVNCSGGTDSNGALIGGNPLTPVYAGECQGVNTGMSTEVYELLDGPENGDHDSAVVQGKRVKDGQAGELVLTRPFPTMPVMFWGPHNKEQYFNSYFAKYDDVWTQGDYALVNPITSGVCLLGRSDGVLNPSGIRFGSTELYTVLETHFSKCIADSIAVGQKRSHDMEESVILFLLMKPGKSFTIELVKEVKAAIARDLSKRHVPRYVFETPEIPTTVNFKKVEVPVKKIVSGENVRPSETLRNPESLKWYKKFVDIEKVIAENRAGRL